MEYKWQAIADVNSLLEGYFAVCDQGYVFPKRKKIQKMLQVQCALCEYKEVSLSAEVAFRKMICDRKDCTGRKAYSAEKFEKDILPFANATDNFFGTGQHFLCFINDRIKEMTEFVK